jgi:ribonuclease Z
MRRLAGGGGLSRLSRAGALCRRQGPVAQMSFSTAVGQQAKDARELSGGMDIVFLGTSSGVPSSSRGTTCIALRNEGDIWLFDTGEGSQRQMQRSIVRPTLVKKIFITHMHGDHVFGLPAILCLMGLARMDTPTSDVIDIYGPEGLRDFLYSSIQATYSTVCPRFRVHELKDIPWRGNRQSRRQGKGQRQSTPRTALPPGSFLKQQDLDDSRDIYPDSDGIYHLVRPKDMSNSIKGSDRGSWKDKVSIFKRAEAGAGVEVGTDDGNVIVQAAPMDHTIPCVGYVVTELGRPGTLHPERVVDLVRSNRLQLTGYLGLQKPEHVYKVLKSLDPGGSFTFPDGAVVLADDIMDPPRRGRKVVFMGDTSSGRGMERVAMDADLVVHEATNAWVPGNSNMEDRHSSAAALEQELVRRGHSSADMAGVFAARIRAKHLVLTHFSSRFGGGDSPAELSIMNVFRRRALNAAGVEGQRRDGVAAPKSVSRSSNNNSNSNSNSSGKTSVLKEESSGHQLLVTTAYDFLVVGVHLESRNLVSNTAIKDGHTF